MRIDRGTFRSDREPNAGRGRELSRVDGKGWFTQADWARSSGSPARSAPVLLQPQPNQQRIEQLVIESQSAGDVVGPDEDRPRFGRVVVGQVLEVFGNRTLIQVDEREAIGEPGRSG